MTTTINLPDDLAGEVERRAAAAARDVADEVVDLVRKGLAAPVAAPVAGPPPLSRPVIATDPHTGLPVIRGEPGAPISTMSVDEMHALIQRLQEEEDLERFGLPLRR